jgi:hypothetical protein
MQMQAESESEHLAGAWAGAPLPQQSHRPATELALIFAGAWR